METDAEHVPFHDEVAAWNTETRLKTFVLNMVKSLELRVQTGERCFDELKAEIAGQKNAISYLQDAQQEVENLSFEFKQFRTEVMDAEELRKHNELKNTTTVTGLINEMELLQHALEEKSSTMQGVVRHVGRQRAEIEQLRQECAGLDATYSQRFQSIVDTSNTTHNDFTTKIAVMEQHHRNLVDEVELEREALVKVRSECRKTGTNLAEIKTIGTHVHAPSLPDYVTKTALDEVEKDIRASIDDQVQSMTDLSEGMGRVVVEVKELFQTVQATLARENTVFAKEVHSRYSSEILKTKQLRDDAERAKSETQATVEKLTHETTVQGSYCKSATTELREMLLAEEQTRRTEKEVLDAKIKTLTQTLDTCIHNYDVSKKVLTHVTEVMTQFLHIEGIQSRLDVQDAIDRSSVALIGCGENSEVHDTVPKISIRPSEGRLRTPSESPMNNRRDRTSGNDPELERLKQHSEVVRNFVSASALKIDERCLGCMENANIGRVIPAFKLACLTYAPSNVCYQSKIYTRTEILEKRHEMLREVERILQSPPETDFARAQQDILNEFAVLRRMEKKLGDETPDVQDADVLQITIPLSSPSSPHGTSLGSPQWQSPSQSRRELKVKMAEVLKSNRKTTMPRSKVDR